MRGGLGGQVERSEGGDLHERSKVPHLPHLRDDSGVNVPAQIHTPHLHRLPWGGSGDQGEVKVGPSFSIRGAVTPGTEVRIQATCFEPTRVPLGSTLEEDTAGKRWAAAPWEQQPTLRLRVRGKTPWWKGREPETEMEMRDQGRGTDKRERRRERGGLEEINQRTYILYM